MADNVANETITHQFNTLTCIQKCISHKTSHIYDKIMSKHRHQQSQNNKK